MADSPDTADSHHNASTLAPITTVPIPTTTLKQNGMSTESYHETPNYEILYHYILNQFVSSTVIVFGISKWFKCSVEKKEFQTISCSIFEETKEYVEGCRVNCKGRCFGAPRIENVDGR